MPAPQPWRAGKREGDAGPRPDANGMDAGVPEGDLGIGLPLYIFVHFSVCAQLPQTVPHAG